MNRRQFVSTAGAAAGAGVAALPTGFAAGVRKRALMKLGCQSGPTTDRMLQFFKRHGVSNICGYPPDPGARGYWTVEELTQLRERAERHGVSVDLVPLPFLSSGHILDAQARPAIMLGESPQRDRDIEDVHRTIRNCAAAGIPATKYYLALLPILRTGRTAGRGGVTYSTWRLAEAKQDPPLTRAGKVTADMMWERITYFLERVVPVAEEYKIRLACHPHDPGLPPEGFQGIDHVLGTVEGLKRFVSIKESPYHGLNFCQGTVCEMLQDPGKGIFDVIRYFGTRKKIFNVHFRNIRGKRNNFQEVYPDEGEVDFVKAMMVYKEVEYPYMIMPDHVPYHKDDPGGSQAFAFGYGYIRALIQAVDELA
jgi:mannonate dehydratase